MSGDAVIALVGAATGGVLTLGAGFAVECYRERGQRRREREKFFVDLVSATNPPWLSLAMAGELKPRPISESQVFQLVHEVTGAANMVWMMGGSEQLQEALEELGEAVSLSVADKPRSSSEIVKAIGTARGKVLFHSRAELTLLRSSRVRWFLRRLLKRPRPRGSSDSSLASPAEGT